MVNCPAFTTPLLLPLSSTPSNAPTTPLYMQASSNGRRPNDRRPQNTSRRFRQKNDRQQNQFRYQQKRQRRDTEAFDEDNDIRGFRDEYFVVDEDENLSRYDSRQSRNLRSRTTLPSPRNPTNKRNVPDSRSTNQVDNENFDLEAADDSNDKSEEFSEDTQNGSDVDDQLANDLSLYDDSVDNDFFARYRKQPSSERKPENSPVSKSTATKGSNRANQEAVSSAFDAVDRLFDTFKSDRNSSSPSATSNRGSLPSEATTRRSSSQRNNHSDRNSENSGTQLDRKTWLENVKARAATTSAKTASREVQLHTKSSSDVNEKAVDVDAVEDVSSAPGGFADNQKTNGDGQEILGKAPEKNENNSKGFDTDDVENALLSEEKRSVLANEEEESRSQRQENGRARTIDNSVDGPKQGRRFRDQTEGDSEMTNFRTSTFQVLMQIARQGPIGDPGMGAKRKVGRSVRNDRSNTSGNTKERGAAALTALTGDSVIAEENMERGTGLRSTGRVRNESDNVTSGDVSQKLKRIISGQLGRDRGVDSTYELIDDEMDREIDVKRLETREMRRQRFSSVRRTMGKMRRGPIVPREWQPITEEEVSKVIPDNRPLQPSSARGRKHAAGEVSNCAECNGSGLETCIVCVGEGWIAPLRSFDVQKDVNADRLRLLDEIWTTPNLVVNSQGEAQCIRCNGLGKQLCHDCKGSGSSLRKGFSLSDKYKAFDIFGGSEDGPPDMDIDFEQSNVGNGDEDEDGIDEDDEGDEDDEDSEDDFDMFQLFQGSAETLGVFNKRAVRKGVDIHTAPDSEDEDENDNEDIVYPLQDESEELLATLEAMDIADLEDQGPSLDRRLGIRSKPLRTSAPRIDEDEDDDDDSSIHDDFDEDEDESGDLIDDEDDEDVSAVVRKTALREEDDEDDIDVNDLEDDDDFDEVIIEDEDDEVEPGLNTRGG